MYGKKVGTSASKMGRSAMGKKVGTVAKKAMSSAIGKRVGGLVKKRNVRTPLNQNRSRGLRKLA